MALLHFTRKLDIFYETIIIDKKECENDILQLISQISKKIAELYTLHADYFKQFDTIVLYYDKGQIQLHKILVSTFSALFPSIRIRKEFPDKYKLFQVADLLCILSLINEKGKNNALSNSEKKFFHTYREFRKNYLKQIEKKRLSNMLNTLTSNIL